MKKRLFVAGCLLNSLRLFAASPEDLVEVRTFIPTVRLDIRYATANNFMHRPLYPSAKCMLRRGTLEKLKAVQDELAPMGLGLKIYDGFRPIAVQREMWTVVHDDRYVADPAKGSRHNRGAAVDLTLVDRKGKELPMPTPYDDFTEKAHRDYQQLPAEALKNRQTLEDVMRRHGFEPLPTEWWHFDDADWNKYPLQ